MIQIDTYNLHAAIKYCLPAKTDSRLYQVDLTNKYTRPMNFKEFQLTIKIDLLFGICVRGIITV